MTERRPTASEMEILQTLWRTGSSTVRRVHEELTKNKEAGYTTTLKLMQIMHEKGLVERDTTSRGWSMLHSLWFGFAGYLQQD